VWNIPFVPKIIVLVKIVDEHQKRLRIGTKSRVGRVSRNKHCLHLILWRPVQRPIWKAIRAFRQTENIYVHNDTFIYLTQWVALASRLVYISSISVHADFTSMYFLQMCRNFGIFNWYKPTVESSLQTIERLGQMSWRSVAIE